MALIKCTQCGNKLPLDAQVCPSCGRPISKNMVKKIEQVKEKELINKNQKLAKERENKQICPKCHQWIDKKLNTCPICDTNLIFINILAIIIIVSFVLFIIVGIITSQPTEIGKREKEERRQKIESCHTYTNTYQRCSWSAWENRCVCKQR